MRRIERHESMHRVKLMLLILLLVAGVTSVNARERATKIRWLSTHYDFGSFREADGEVTGSVSFVNEGDSATFIGRVRPGCGCTGASYPKSMIEPGDTATIKFTYNPAGRPGKFDKTVRVWVGKENQLTTVHITGTVIGDRSTMQWYYPVEVGPLRMEKDIIDAGEIKRGDSRQIFLTLCNQTTDSVTPVVRGDSEIVTVDVSPATIAPGELAVMSLYYRSGLDQRNGPVEHRVTLIPDSVNPDEVKEITLSATVIPEVAPLTREVIEHAPLAMIKERVIDLGKVGSGKIPFEFQLDNQGKGDLHVDRVYTHGSAPISLAGTPKKIKPGKTATIKGKLQTSGLPSGPFRQLIEVLTDDPVHPTVSVDLVGEKTE